MKKIYKQALIGAMCLASTGVFADETITIKNFAPDAQGVVYNANGIKVTVVKDASQSSYTATSSGSWSCLSVNGNTSSLYLRKDLTTKGYIDIELTGSTTIIKSLQYVGAGYTGTNQSQYVVAFSADGSTFPATPNNLYPTATGTITLATVYSLPAALTGACTDPAVLSLPANGKAFQGAASGTRTTEVTIKKIRLAGETIQSKSLSNSENAYILGIIMTISGTSTGAEEIAAEKTAVSSSYYDLSGKAVSADAKGFVIRKTLYSDGSVANEKGYNR
jgi:hypothetical protein